MANIKGTKETLISINIQLTEREASYLRGMFQNSTGIESDWQSELRRQMFVALGGPVMRNGNGPIPEMQ